MTNFKIRTFGRTELAQLYCPELCPQAAFRKLNQWIDLYPNLREELLASGLSPKSRTYTPAQVGLIVGALENRARTDLPRQPDTYQPHLQQKKTAFHSLNPPLSTQGCFALPKGYSTLLKFYFTPPKFYSATLKFYATLPE